MTALIMIGAPWNSPGYELKRAAAWCSRALVRTNASGSPSSGMIQSAADRLRCQGQAPDVMVVCATNCQQASEPVAAKSQENAAIHHAERIPDNDTVAYLEQVILISARFSEVDTLHCGSPSSSGVARKGDTGNRHVSGRLRMVWDAPGIRMPSGTATGQFVNKLLRSQNHRI
jgi:hypothetical protein